MAYEDKDRIAALEAALAEARVDAFRNYQDAELNYKRARAAEQALAERTRERDAWESDAQMRAANTAYWQRECESLKQALAEANEKLAEMPLCWGDYPVLKKRALDAEQALAAMTRARTL